MRGSWCPPFWASVRLGCPWLLLPQHSIFWGMLLPFLEVRGGGVLSASRNFCEALSGLTSLALCRQVTLLPKVACSVSGQQSRHRAVCRVVGCLLAPGPSLPPPPGVYVLLCFLEHHPCVLGPCGAQSGRRRSFLPGVSLGLGSVSHVFMEALSGRPREDGVTAAIPVVESGQRMDQKAWAGELPGALEPKVWASFSPVPWGCLY